MDRDYWSAILGAALSGAAATTTAGISASPAVLSNPVGLGILAAIGAATHVAAVLKDPPKRTPKKVSK